MTATPTPTPVPNDARRYLAAADAMLAGAGKPGAAAVAGGWWPKACACLIRLALETAINEHWLRTAPAVAAYGSGRAKLLLLRRRQGKMLAREAAYAWSVLSRAAHHHCYESAPTHGELRRLHDAVRALIGQL